MKSVRFHSEAEVEMIQAASWYEATQKDLGKRFLASVQDSVTRIELNPRLFPLVQGEVRRCLTKTFPFGVLFREESQQIVVMAVMQLHREPDYWKHRTIEQPSGTDG